MTVPHTPTTIQRYPPSLSQSPSGPSRPPRTYPIPSIDSSVASPPIPSAPLNEYTSLQDLLQRAGYKETRVYTPEAEKVRKHIKKTLDDNEEEVNALYGTYGFDRTRGLGIHHAHQNVTEPIIPMKRSASILRSLALQAAARSKAAVKEEAPEHSWWTTWGKTQKISSPEAPTKVGLGLAKNGEGVRKVQSAWDVERGRWRRAETESPPQEERPPLPQMRQASIPHEMTAATGYTTTKTATCPMDRDIFSSPPPPQALSDDAFGYCPLPDDYEAQCDEDEALYAMGVNDYDVYSIGSYSASESAHSMHSRTPSDDRAEREIRDFENEVDDGLLDEVNEVGKRLLASAVEYDEDLECDSPPMRTWVLPQVDASRPHEAPKIPLPSPPVDVAPPEEKMDKVPEPAKPLTYGDRATKLRLAHSTPNLKKSDTESPSLPAGWLRSIRNALLGSTQTPSPTPATSSWNPSIPIKVTAPTPAQPRLVTAGPVICDSASGDAEDLPPIPTPKAKQSSGPISLLRLRPSIAKLRDAVLGQYAEADRDDPLVLSPRMDWKQQGEQFAGWSPMKKKSDGGEGESLYSARGVGVDFSKSFFYKPGTPPKVKASGGCETPKASNTVSRGLKKQRSIKSLQAALLLPVASSPIPPVPPIPSHLSTPKRIPVLAIQSPQAARPRELVLDGDEFNPQSAPGSDKRGRANIKKGNGVRRRKSKKKSVLKEESPI
ncbi:hypothetical protein C343_06979 [Cryptococcus neoformans C23]|nr:hypothetical protein C343_06979 [Cryptococcus neoformans var. grubii C23]